MSAFYRGQPVRKARGEWNIGATGVVSGFDPGDEFGMTLGVVMNQEVTGEHYCGERVRVPAGTEVFGYPSDFEPILPRGLESPAEIDALFEPSHSEELA